MSEQNLDSIMGASEDRSPDRKWDEDDIKDPDLYQRVVADFHNLANASNYNSRVRLLDLWTSVYHDRPFAGENSDELGVYAVLSEARLNRLNVIRDGSKRIMNMVVKSQPRPMYLSTNGSALQRQAGEDATDYMAALFKKLEVNQASSRQALDAIVWGTGLLRVRGREGAGQFPVVERLYPHDVIVDRREAMYGEPRHKFIQHLIPRSRLYAWAKQIAKKYGKSEKKLAEIVRTSGEDPFTDIYYRHSDLRWSDMVRVVEAVALPSIEGAGDGRKAFVTSSGVLWAGEWDRMDDGIVALRWSIDLEDTFFGIGVPREGAGLFQALDDVMQKLEECHDLMTSQVWQEQGSEIEFQKTSNIPWGKYTYKGTPPLFMTPTVASSDTYAYAQELYNKFYAMLGVPSNEQDRAKSGQSGIAIQLEEDKKSGNLTLFAEAYEQARMKLGDYLLRELAEMDSPPDLAYTDAAKGVARMINFGLVKENLANLRSTIYPVSQMSSNPQGKIDQMERLMAMQVVTPEDAAEVFNWPDLKSVTAGVGAPRKLVDLYIDHALMGDNPGPNPDLPEAYMRSRANDRLAEAELAGASEDDLEGLRAWIAVQDAAYKARAAANAPPPIPPQPLPGEMPGAEMPIPSPEGTIPIQ